MYIYIYIHTLVKGVMKMENITPRAGIEPISLAFWVSVVAITSCRLPDATTVHFPNCICGPPCLRDQCRQLHLFPWNCKFINAYNYIHTGNDLSYKYVYTACSAIPIQCTACTGSSRNKQDVMKMENGKYCTQSRNRTQILYILAQCAKYYTNYAP